MHWHHDRQGVTITVFNVTMLASLCETLASICENNDTNAMTNYAIGEIGYNI